MPGSTSHPHIDRHPRLDRGSMNSWIPDQVGNDSYTKAFTNTHVIPGSTGDPFPLDSRLRGNDTRYSSSPA
jgi:hypothetical protein